MTEPSLLPIQASGYLESVVGDVVPALLAVVAALVILLVGIIVGRIVGGIVKRTIERIRPSKYTAGTPLERRGNMDNDVAQAVGDLVKYVIYFLALLLALAQVDLPLPGDVLSGITAAALRIVVAAVILIVGFAIGRFVSGIIEDVVDGFGLETYIRDTPLATAARSVGGVGSAIAMVIEYLIYYFALVAAVDQLQFQALSQPLSVFIAQLPLVIAGVLILVVGIYVADIIGDFVANINASRVTDLAGMVVQLFVYYIVVVFALDTAGFDTSVLLNLFNTVVVAFFGALGVALALAVGIGVGWGSKDYVAENIDDWVRSARNSASDLTEESDSRSGDNFDSPGSTDD